MSEIWTQAKDDAKVARLMTENASLKKKMRGCPYCGSRNVACTTAGNVIGGRVPHRQHCGDCKLPSGLYDIRELVKKAEKLAQLEGMILAMDREAEDDQAD